MTEDSLDARVKVAADMIVLGTDWDPDKVVELGVELLVRGHDGPAVVALASFSRRASRAEVDAAAREAFAELGFVLPDQRTAMWNLALYWANQLKLGGSHTYRRAAALCGMWWTLGRPPEIGVLVQLMDAWEETLPGERRRALEAELALLAGPIIVTAQRAIAGLA